MQYIKSRKHVITPTPRCSVCGIAKATLMSSLAMAVPALARDNTTTELPDIAQAKSLPAVMVSAIGAPDYRIGVSASPKFTQPLLDTTQTVQIISSDLFNQQGATTLTEALRNSPGVGTFYVGENGNTSTGDAVYLRGFDTSGSIFVDGVRDLGSISRDVFNIDQIEVTKGPDGTEFGRTAPTGAINLISKQPLTGNLTSASIAYGSGMQRRGTVDWNHQIAPHSAFRLNLMDQDSGVAGRDKVKNKRWGVAPALAFGLGTPTRVYVDYLHIKQDNLPDGGVPTIGLPGYTSPDPTRPQLANAPRVDSDGFYGTDADHDRVQADMLTARIEHEFSENTTLRNTTRWGRTRQDYVLSSFMSAGKYFTTLDLSDPATWSIRRLPNFKHQNNSILTNQTNLRSDFTTGDVTHNLSAGIELTREGINTVGMGALGDGSWPAVNLYHPNAHVGALDYGETGAWSKGHTDTAAAYVFDTVKFGEHWQVNAGVRMDHYRTQFHDVVQCGGRRGPDCGGQPEGTPITDVDTTVSGNLPNWKLGVLYKPRANGSIYANFAVSQEPPGGNTLELSSRANNADNPNFDPQKARTTELGTKWNLLDERLLLTGAIYRTVVNNQVEQDPVDLQYYQVGQKRVQGIEINAVGKLTDHWSISAGYTSMDTKVTRGAAIANDGSDDLAYTPTSAFTAWTTYHLPFNLTIGGGARYSGALKRGHDGAIGTPEYTTAYWVFDAMASYPVNRHFDLQLNLYNLFDKDYVAAINKSGYRYTPGRPRSAMLTANIRF